MEGAELTQLSLKERKEKLKAIMEEGTRREKKKAKREISGGRPVKRVANRVKTRARGFSRTRKSGGLAAVLFPGVSPEEFYEYDSVCEAIGCATGVG